MVCIRRCALVLISLTHFFQVLVVTWWLRARSRAFVEFPLHLLEVTIYKTFNHSLPSSKSTFSQPSKEKRISEIVRIGSLSQIRNAKFFILCDVILVVRLQGKFEIDHS